MSIAGLGRLMNGTHIALAQRWLRDGTRHCDVGDPVRRHAVDAATTARAEADGAVSCAAAIRARLSAAPEVARFSSLKRLTIGCDIAALMALRTALAPPNGILGRSLEALELVGPWNPTPAANALGNAWLVCVRCGANSRCARSGRMHRRRFSGGYSCATLCGAGSGAFFGECNIAALMALRTALAPPNGVLSRSLEDLTFRGLHYSARELDAADPTNPWLVYGAEQNEADAAFEATGWLTLSAAAAALVRDGLRHNTALTHLTFADRRLTDAVVCDGLLPLLLPPHASTAANRTLRSVWLNRNSQTAECLPAIARIITAAATHGLRELHVSSMIDWPGGALQSTAVRALASLAHAGTAHCVVFIRAFAENKGDAAIEQLSGAMKRRAARARRQWARIAVAAASYRAVRVGGGVGLPNSVQPLPTVITALAEL